MIDLHTHILPGVDDGSQIMEESLKMIRKAKAIGFQGIILTPHYMCYTYQSRVADNQKILEELKKAVKKEGLDIFLFLGNEVCYHTDVINLIGTEAFTTINKSRYLLVETKSQVEDLFNLERFVFELQLKGLIPIIAHPERYRFVQKDPNVLVNMVNSGALAQMNILSLVGYYGTKAQETAEILLTHNMIHFLGSDAHNHEAYDEVKKGIKIATRLVGKKKMQDLFRDHPRRVLVNAIVPIEEPEFYNRPRKKKTGLKRIWAR
jgi:protein-tyrosine phosphatase